MPRLKEGGPIYSIEVGRFTISKSFDLIDFEYPKIRKPAMKAKQWIVI